MTIGFKLNGKTVSAAASEDALLLWHLRTERHLMGSKFGCGKGVCGACTVLLDGKPARSCRVRLKDVDGREVLTIEGLAKDGRLAAVQQAFIDEDAFQCGFCTPGMILEAYALLQRKPKPTEEDIKQGLNGHFCRCGTYKRIIKAVQSAAEASHG